MVPLWVVRSEPDAQLCRMYASEWRSESRFRLFVAKIRDGSPLPQLLIE